MLCSASRRRTHVGGLDRSNSRTSNSLKPGICRGDQAANGRFGGSLPILAAGRIVVLVQRFLRPRSVGEVRRRRLVARRRLGQRFPRRLARERRGLGLVAAAENLAQSAGKAELRRAQDWIVGHSGLHGIIVGARLRCDSPDIHLAWRQRPGRFHYVLLLFLLAGLDGGLAAGLVGILRPVRRLHLGGRRRRRQIELGRHHQRRALAIVDALVLHVGGAEAAQDALDDLFLEGLVVLFVVVLRPRRTGYHDEADTKSNCRQTQAAQQSSRRTPYHPDAGFGLAHHFTF